MDTTDQAVTVIAAAVKQVATPDKLASLRAACEFADREGGFPPDWSDGVRWWMDLLRCVQVINTYPNGVDPITAGWVS